jgi:hypothetical protein
LHSDKGKHIGFTKWPAEFCASTGLQDWYLYSIALHELVIFGDIDL